MSQAPYSELAEMVENFTDRLIDYEGLQNVDTDLRLNTPELRVEIDRDKLADAGIAVEVVGRTLESLLGGRQVTRFESDGEQYDVIVEVDKQSRATPADISDIFVRNRGGRMVPLGSFISVEETVAPQSLNHSNRLRAVIVKASVAACYALVEVLESLHGVADVVLPPSVQTDLDVQSREFRDSSGSMYFVFALVLVFIYLVMASQFESWGNPFILMLSVPLSMTSALFALWLGGGALSIDCHVGLST